MSTITIDERGIESALFACPQAATASHVERTRRTVAPVMAFQGTGLPFGGTYGAGDAAGAPVVRQVDTFVKTLPIHPGDTSRRPPA